MTGFAAGDPVEWWREQRRCWLPGRVEGVLAPDLYWVADYSPTSRLGDLQLASAQMRHPYEPRPGDRVTVAYSTFDGADGVVVGVDADAAAPGHYVVIIEHTRWAGISAAHLTPKAEPADDTTPERAFAIRMRAKRRGHW